MPNDGSGGPMADSDRKSAVSREHRPGSRNCISYIARPPRLAGSEPTGITEQSVLKQCLGRDLATLLIPEELTP